MATPGDAGESLANAAMAGLALVGWGGLFVGLLRRRRPPRGQPRVRRDARGWLGFILQAFGGSFMWGQRRGAAETMLGPPGPIEVLFVLCTALLSALAVSLLWNAFREIGEQWSIGASVRAGHELVTTGPYARVRHPIYSGIGALFVATGLAFDTPAGLLAGIVIYGLGTAIRVQGEESVLRATFGEAYAAYAARVPALIPRLRVA